MDRREAVDVGCAVYCGACRAAYEDVPLVEFEDGHGGVTVPRCLRCGDPMILRLEDDTPVRCSGKTGGIIGAGPVS